MANEKLQQATASLASSIIPEFHGASDDWNVYREILEEFYRANGITGAARVPVLLSVIGKGTYRTVRGLCHPRSPKEMEYDELCRVMARQFVPEIAVFRLRSRFYRAEQRRCGESVKQWYARLKALSVECQFGEQQLEPLLLDRFVIGLAPGPVQNRLCEELPGSLTLERAVDIAAAAEAAQHGPDEAEEMVQEFAELGLGGDGAGGDGEQHCRRRHRGRHGRHARFGFPGHEAMGPWGPFGGRHHRHGRRHRHQHPHAPAWHSEAEEVQPHRFHHHRRHHQHGAAPHWGPPAGFYMPAGFGRPCHRERPSRSFLGGGPGMMCPGSSYERRLAKKWRKMHCRMRRSSSTSSSSSSSSSGSSGSSSSSSSSSTSGSASETEREPQTDKKCRKRDKREAAAQRKHHGKHHGHGRHEHGHGHGRRRGHGHGHHGHGHGHHHHPHGFEAGSRRHQHRSRRQQPTADETQPINNEPTTEPELIE